MNGHASAHYTYAAPIKASRSERDGRNGPAGEWYPKGRSSDLVYLCFQRLVPLILGIVLGICNEVVRVVVSRCVFFVRALAILAAMHGLERGLALFLVGGAALDSSRFGPDSPKTNQHDDPGGFGLTGVQRRLFMFFSAFWCFLQGSQLDVVLPTVRGCHGWKRKPPSASVLARVRTGHPCYLNCKGLNHPKSPNAHRSIPSCRGLTL